MQIITHTKAKEWIFSDSEKEREIIQENKLKSQKLILLTPSFYLTRINLWSIANSLTNEQTKENHWISMCNFIWNSNYFYKLKERRSRSSLFSHKTLIKRLYIKYFIYSMNLCVLITKLNQYSLNFKWISLNHVSSILEPCLDFCSQLGYSFA